MASIVITDVQKVSTLVMNDREFTLVRFHLVGELPDWHSRCEYGSIEAKYINADGRLNTALNLAMLAYGKTLEEAIERRRDFLNCEGKTLEEVAMYFINKGRAEAACGE